MPRLGPRRTNTIFRMSDEQTADADQRAIEEGLANDDGSANRSELIRLAIKYALIHMPRGWRP